MATNYGSVGNREGVVGNIGGSSRVFAGIDINAEAKKLEDLYVKAGKKSTKIVEEYRAHLTKKALQDETKERKQIVSELNKSSSNIVKQFGQKIKDAFTDLGATFDKINAKFSGSIDNYINTYTKYMGVMTTRLQGTSLNFNNILKDVSYNLSTSPILKQTDMIDNLNRLVESGISYNLESRAYIATATSKIATTFNAFDSSLLRIIRIQQADSTVARLGMESLITKFLNARYEDTSYLNSTSKSVSNLLLEAESLMGYKGATEFEYVVQKWLGSMNALGVSENTISSIATGLGYLGSGNISALSSNQALQNLLVMAASRAGLDYGKLLTGGLSGSTASRLLSSIVNLGQTIAGSGNYVVQSQYASLFGLNISDLVSLTNITTQDLKEITKDIVKYEGLRQETTNQLQTMYTRTSASEMVANVFSNMLTSMGANVATNPVAYGAWEAAKLLEGSGLDYEFSVAPFGVGTKFSMSQLMKTAVIGVSGITALVNAIGNIYNGNGLGTNFGVWKERQTRGTTASAYGTAGRTVSGSSYFGTLDSSDLSRTFQSNQEETSQYTGEQQEDDATKTLRDDIAPNVASILAIMNEWDTMLKTSNLSTILGI